MVAVDLQAVARKVKDHFVALVDAAFENVNVAPHAITTQIGDLGNLKASLFQGGGHEPGIVAGVFEGIHFLVGIVAYHQRNAFAAARPA